MRLNFPTHRLAAAVAIAGGAIGLLATAAPAAATMPGSNGLIATYKCDDGSACTNSHIWTLDPVTGAQQQLTFGPGRDREPMVSPDGKRIAFVRCAVGVNCEIDVMNSDGSGVTPLTHGGSNAGDDAHPSFSPDGNRIVFSHCDPDHHLYVMNADGSGLSPLTSGAVEDGDPAFSPDGSSVVFSRFTGGTVGLFTVPANGGAATRLTTGLDFQPDYSPDGSKIVFSRYASRIMVMDANGANAHALTSPAPNTGDKTPSFSPDGTQIAYSHFDNANTSVAPVMLMNVDGSNAHPITGSSSDYALVGGWQPTHAAPPSSPPAAHTGAPGLRLSAPKKESVRKGRLYLFATSSEAGNGIASGKVAVPKLAKSYRLRPATKALGANARTKITLKVPAKSLRAVRTALTRHQSVKATLVVRIKDGAGNSTSEQLKIRLTK